MVEINLPYLPYLPELKVYGACDAEGERKFVGDANNEFYFLIWINYLATQNKKIKHKTLHPFLLMNMLMNML
jgi:hypothetical protein